MACRPHYSGTTLDAQARYAAGTKEILRRTFDNEPLNETDVIVQARSCSFCLSLSCICSCSLSTIHDLSLPVSLHRLPGQMLPQAADWTR